MKILIIGGGIGGLAAAGFLERKGFDVTLIERAPAFKHIGFGMTLFSNARALLAKLGAHDRIAEAGYEIPSIELNDTTGKRIPSKALDFAPFRRFGEPVITIERSIVHDALRSCVRNTRVRLGTVTKKIEMDDARALVTFSDDSQEAFDLVIAADGINSELRDEFFGPGHSSFYGWSLRFFWVPSHIPILPRAICPSREGITLALYPLKEKYLAGIYEYNPERIDNPPFNLEMFFPYLSQCGWTRDDLDRLAHESAEGRHYYDHLRYVSLEQWYHKRMVLIGDARHGINPITGLGGAMALEDAFVLAEELAASSERNIDAALLAYARRRNGRVRQVQSISRLSERFFFARTPFERIARDAMARILPASILIRKLERVLGAQP